MIIEYAVSNQITRINQSVRVGFGLKIRCFKVATYFEKKFTNITRNCTEQAEICLLYGYMDLRFD